MRLHTLSELGRFNNLRAQGRHGRRQDIPGMANISKLSMSDIVRLQRDLGLRIVGPQRHAPRLQARADRRRSTRPPATRSSPMVTGMALFAQAPPIYGGTDQIQRNIIGERVLGLPKEPGNDSSTPFSELPKNA